MSQRVPGAAVPSAGRARAGSGLARVVGAALTVLVLLLNVPGNPILELRHAKAGGTVLAHVAVLLLGVGLWPTVSRALCAMARTDAGPRLLGRLAIVIAAGAAGMVGLAAAWPDYARQLLSREWGLVEPLQFVLYLLVARLCFTLAGHWQRGTRRRRLFVLGGWLGRLFALEEIDYLGVLASLLILGGIDRARIEGSYVGALHDALNVADQHGILWVAALAVAVGGAAAIWWAGYRSVRAVRRLLSWRVAPAGVGAAFMALAQFKDIDGRESVVPLGRLFNDLLEEPCELLAILCLNVTLVLELARVRALDTPIRP